jgi:acyl carrier protein
MEENLREVFVRTLKINSAEVIDSLSYNEIPEWDSLAHMILVAAIEEEFDIMIDVDDVIAMSSFLEAKTIVAKNL